VAKAIRDKVDFEVDYRIVHPDKTVRDIHGVCHLVLDGFGEVVEHVGTVMDITERKLAEDAIRRSEAFLAEGQRLSHTGSWGWNASTGKLIWSEEHFRILGLDPRDTKPSLDLFWERVHPDDRMGLQRTFESAIREKRDFEQEFRIVTLDRCIRYLHGVGHAILNKTGELAEFIGSTMDITERKRVDAALQEARAELERVTRVTTMGELAASIAHEINQPLAGVVTSANAGLNWLAANPPDLARTRETLERILRDGTRGGEVLSRIRTLFKRTPPAKTLVGMNQTVRDVLALIAGELRQHNIELSLELASRLPAISGDSIQLQQVLLNLIKNAIEAMAGKPNGQGTLRITSRFGELDGNPAAVVEVSDTGVGFSDSDTSRLFEAFHTTKSQGMGMGLWISRSIIENHHGRLTASSNNGPGATFMIMLPKASQEPA
jgi:signal transduction histidine kinase